MLKLKNTGLLDAQENQELKIRNDFILNIKYKKKFDVAINNAVLEHQFNLYSENYKY